MPVQRTKHVVSKLVSKLKGEDRQCSVTGQSLQSCSQRYFEALLKIARDLAPVDWPLFLNIGPLEAGVLERLPYQQRASLLCRAIRRATCHPFVDWNIDYSGTEWNEATALAGILVGYGNKCGPISHITKVVLERYAVETRVIQAQGTMPDGTAVGHIFNEARIGEDWWLVDNDVFQHCDDFFVDDDGMPLSRAQVVDMGVSALVKRYPTPYTYASVRYQREWVEHNWQAWYSAVSGHTSIVDR